MNPINLAPALAGTNRQPRSEICPGQGRGYVGSVACVAMVAVMLCVMLGAAPDRPRDPWVFRCVLDKNARMVVIALHENLWVAYDAKTCSLYKAWRGDVKFDGAVYTTVHGPQPTSVGDTYFDGPQDNVWFIRRDEELIQPQQVLWRGYSIRDNTVSLRYELILADGSSIEIEEVPEVSLADDQLVFSRSFTLTGVAPRDQILLNLSTERERLVERVQALSAVGGAGQYVDSDLEDNDVLHYSHFLRLNSAGVSGVEATLPRTVNP